MNDETDIWDVEATRGKVGSDKDVCRAVSELAEGAVSLLLFEGAVIEFVDNTFLLQELAGAVDRLTMVAENDDGAVA